MKKTNNYDAEIAKLVRERDNELEKYWGYECEQWLACYEKYDGLIASEQLAKRREVETPRLNKKSKKRSYYANSSEKTILQ